MSYEPLHHKYRPQTFAQLVGQGAIATTLSHALQQQRIAPAYLFTGPRGTGKTSSARILAKSLNCLQSDVPTEEPCGTCETCRMIAKGSALDVIEIDAASNTGVDNIRELIERAQFAPVQCRYKVYIIDEVHMLSTAAFNALLKTLEEPPARVVFVLATTDPQRVLPTIISRCQRFDYRRIPLNAMVQHLGAIAQAEDISVAADALELIAQLAQGGMRDAESLLDQLSLLDGQITVERVWDLVGAVPERDLLILVRAIAQDDGTAVLEQARHLMNRGREPLIVLQNLASFYRDLLIAKTAGNRRDLVTLTQPTWDALCEFAQTLEMGTILLGQQHLRASEVQVKNTTQPRLWLEITLMGLLPSTLAGMQTRGGVSEGVSKKPVYVAPPSAPQVVSPSVPQKDKPLLPTVPSGISTSPNVEVTPDAKAPVTEAKTTIGVSEASETTTFTVNASTVNASESPSQDAELSTEPEDPLRLEGGRERAPQAEPEETPQSTTASPPALVPEPEPTAPLANNPGYAAFQQEKLNQIWSQVIAAMKPLAQALLREHGCLLAFDGRVARVGISSRPLIGIAQSKQRNIEEAFEKVYDTKIMISFEVGTSPTAAKNVASDEESQGAPPQTPSVRSQAVSMPAPSPPVPAQSMPTAPPSPQTTVPPAASLSPPSSAVTLPQSPVPDKVNSQEAAPAVSSTSQGWQQDDEVTRAAKSLAQMFNGAIVNLDDDDTENQSDEPPLSASDRAENSSVLELKKPSNGNHHRDENQPSETLPGSVPPDLNTLPTPSQRRPINLDDVPF
ncbi:MAG: DNA polymerase III subunit gamma/tau [Cyanobacteria bacterium P01_E01_bin.6]